NRPQGLAFYAGKLFVTVRDSGAGHRGGTLRVVTGDWGRYDSVDPTEAYDPPPIWLLSLTNDGLTGFARVGGRAGNRLVPHLAVTPPSPSDGGRSYPFQLRSGVRYSTGAPVRPQDIRRAIERSLVAGTGDAFTGIVGARRCVGKKSCDLSEGIVADPNSNTVTFHLVA